jgi:fatty-acyl-CoA synthase
MSIKAYDWVAYHARQSPGRLAMVDLYSGRSFTYREMQKRTARLACGLRKQFDIQQGDRVSVLTNNTTDCLEMEFACLKLGAVYVPLNWRLSVPELEYILGDCAPKVLIHEDVFADKAVLLRDAGKTPALLELNAHGTTSDYEQLIDASDEMAEPADIVHDDLWVILYTSGTTGYPKGAMITHGMTFWSAMNTITPLQLAEDMVNLCVLPLFHTGGLNCFCNPAVLLGGVNLIMRRFDPGECLSILQDPELGVTHMHAVPTNYLFMSQEPSFKDADLSRLRTCGIGGSPTPVELLEIYKKKNIGLKQAFGMTETTLVSMLTAENAMVKLGSAGLPALFNQIRIVDKKGNELKDAESVGELWVKGPNVTPGYWKMPEANESSFTGDWFHTGDVARVDADGFLYIVDRWKDMYISGGENVYPAEVENVIYQLPQVSEVAVIGVPHERWGETGQAVIVVKPGKTLTAETVLKHCAERLAKFKQPGSVRFVDEIPHNTVGKVLKRELRASAVNKRSS